ncbi:hypothetical protein K0H33_19615, partial [Bacteroides fragilis]|nr:hypothetical protein [Bacteroides fragilis]
RNWPCYATGVSPPNQNEYTCLSVPSYTNNIYPTNISFKKELSKHTAEEIKGRNGSESRATTKQSLCFLDYTPIYSFYFI